MLSESGRSDHDGRIGKQLLALMEGHRGFIPSRRRPSNLRLIWGLFGYKSSFSPTDPSQICAAHDPASSPFLGSRRWMCATRRGQWRQLRSACTRSFRRLLLNHKCDVCPFPVRGGSVEEKPTTGLPAPRRGLVPRSAAPAGPYHDNPPLGRCSFAADATPPPSFLLSGMRSWQRQT